MIPPKNVYSGHRAGQEALLIGATGRSGPRVLLTAGDATAHDRLSQREIGTQLDLHVRRSAAMAVRLGEAAPPEVLRVPTDGRPVTEIAAEIITATKWS